MSFLMVMVGLLGFPAGMILQVTRYHDATLYVFMASLIVAALGVVMMMVEEKEERNY